MSPSPSSTASVIRPRNSASRGKVPSTCSSGSRTSVSTTGTGAAAASGSPASSGGAHAANAQRAAAALRTQNPPDTSSTPPPAAGSAVTCVVIAGAGADKTMPVTRLATPRPATTDDTTATDWLVSYQALR